ncbi:MAG: RepB plasmid partitioning protein [Syntrophorhabdus sp. PtaU1.Bin153]|nr:MAG: RepB plasmid partitioning protein [Syntrophorhabdus sp. PtaU1.Bin153]
MENKQVHRAFEPKGVMISIDRLLPTKNLPFNVQKSKRYKETAVSIQEVGIIEPPVVFHKKDVSGSYLLLDGHMRVQILKSQGRTEVFCLLATDDEAFTYNKMINRISPIQEHYMIMRALDRGVSEKTLARNLGLDIERIKYKRNLLEGICNEVIDMFKTRNIPATTFKILKKMKPTRQIYTAQLMMGANNYTSTYAKAMLGMTPPGQLQRPLNTKEECLSPEQIASAETEFMNLESEYKLAEQSLGADVLTMLVYRGYISHILENSEVSDYLSQHHGEIFREFQKIAKTSTTEPQQI